MNTRLASLLLAAAFGMPAFPAAADHPAPIDFEVSKATMRGAEVEPGLTEFMVRTTLGQPDQLLSPNLWVYRRFRSDSTKAIEKLTIARGCNILLVQFVKGRVVGLKLMNQPAVEVIVANLSLNRPTGNVASTKSP